jgi:hypothetical protein
MQAAAAYWQQRYTYPTGKYDPAWLRHAAIQDAAVPRGIPAGQVIYNRAGSASHSGRSPLDLDPLGFISLGPRPLDDTGGQFVLHVGRASGRVNALLIHPTNPNIVYLGTAGGGVWKTTNCCTSSTSWQVLTDNPLINTTDITSLAIDPNHLNTVYAGTGDLQYLLFPSLGGSQGILKTTDAGASWTVIGADVFSPLIHPAWDGDPAGLKQAVGKLAVDPANSNNVVAGTRDGLYISNDAGGTWAGPCYTNPFATTQAQIITGLLLNQSGQTTSMYVAVGIESSNLNGADGVYRATLPASGCPAVGDWTLLNTGWPAGTGGGTADPTLPGRIDLGQASSNLNVLYAQVESRRPDAPYQVGGQLGVWQTTNGGTSWNQQSNPTALALCGDVGPGSQPGDQKQNGYDQAVAVDPNDPNTLFIGTIDIFKSTDAGVHFTNLTCGYDDQAQGKQVHADVHALAFRPGSSSDFMAGVDGGAYMTNQANVVPTPPTVPVWTELNDTLNTTEFYSGDLGPNFANAAIPGAVGGLQDNGIVVYTGTVSGPRLWHQPISGDGFFARVDGRTASATGGTWFVENNDGQWWRSTTGPVGQYVRTNVPEPWLTERRSFSPPFDVQRGDCAQGGCTHLIEGSFHVWETTDAGTTWYNSSPSLTKGPNGFINQLHYALGNSALGIAGTDDGNVAMGFGLGQGTPGTWVDVTGANAVLPNRPIMGVTLDPAAPTTGYAAIGGFGANTPPTPGHVYQLTCSGPNCGTATWVDKTGNLPDIPADSIIVNPRFTRQVFVGTDWGLYFTNDITASTPAWQRFQIGLPNVMVMDLTVDEGNTTLAAWTRNRGAYVWPLPDGPFVQQSPTPGPTATPGPSPTACSIQFSDVPPGSTFYDYVRCMACRGIVNGYADGTFRPNNNVTRGQLSKIVSNAAGFNDPQNTQMFEDVPVGSTFFDYVGRLASRGYIGGYPCGGDGEPCGPNNLPYFRPNNNATRGQISKIDSNAAGFNDNPTGQQFEDVDVGSTFYTYTYRLVTRGVMSGYACGGDGEPCIPPDNLPYFRPNNNATRGQTSKIVANTFFPNCQTPAQRR